MAATIQTIVKPTRARGLDTSGNNNNAQIYSGRALEFDGVTDYLECFTALETTHPFFVLANNFTVAFWLKVNTAGDDTVFYATNNDNSSRVGLNVGAEGEIAFTTWNGSIYTHASGGGSNEKIINTSTWYRVVCTCSNNTLKLYLNGILQTGTTTAHSGNLGSTNSNRLRIGERNSVYFDGCLSDFQVWNSVFSQNDVTYDYLNPEQLALNRGGTSLTNSNLKLWYPMNEGHRGDQSYVLDASNTGIGDEIEMDGDFSEFTTISSPRGNSNISGIALTNWIEQGDNDGEYADSTGSGAYTISKIENGIRLETTEVASASWHHRIYNRIGNSLTEGFTYRLKFDLKADAQRAVRIQNTASTIILTDSPVSPSSTEFTTYTEYFTMTGDTNLGFFIFGNGTNVGSFFEIRNVSIVPINAKNNATTVFFGNELSTTANNRTFSGSGNWSSYNSGAIDVNSAVSGKMQITVDGGGTAQGAQLTLTNMGSSIAAGRTYRVQADLDFISGSDTDLEIKFVIGNTGVSVKASDGSPSDGTITTTEETYYADIVAADATGALRINCTSATNDSGSNNVFTVDNVSVKEVGIASGWTDADQQLDIPQTSLQSYNQLAFSDDYRSGISLSDGGTTTHQITTNSHTWSFWMFRNQEDSDQFHYVLQKGTYQESGYYIYLTGGRLHFVTNTSGANESHSTDAIVPKGKWFHAAITVYSSGTASQWYINGQAESSVTGITAPVANTDYTSFYAYDGNNTPPPTTHPGYQCLTELSSWNKKLSKDEVVEIYNDGLALDCTTHSASANLVGYWRNSGLAEWEDLSTNNYHGTPTSITETMLITAGVDSSRDSQGFLMTRQRLTNTLNLPIIDFANNGDAISSNDVEIPNPSLTYSDTGFSFECWFKAEMKSKPMFLVAQQEASNSGEGFHIRWSGANTIYAVISDGTTVADAQISGSLFTNPPKWYHIVVSWDHTNKKKYVYIDGILRQVETESSMGTIAPNTDIHIGTRRGEGSQMFIGQIDDVKLYNRILTDGGVTTGQFDSNGLSIAAKGEVLRNYNAGKRSHK